MELQNSISFPVKRASHNVSCLLSIFIRDMIKTTMVCKHAIEFLIGALWLLNYLLKDPHGAGWLTRVRRIRT